MSNFGEPGSGSAQESRSRGPIVIVGDLMSALKKLTRAGPTPANVITISRIRFCFLVEYLSERESITSLEVVFIQRPFPVAVIHGDRRSAINHDRRLEVDVYPRICVRVMRIRTTQG